MKPEGLQVPALFSRARFLDDFCLVPQPLHEDLDFGGCASLMVAINWQ
jgi:hypothetical protein